MANKLVQLDLVGYYKQNVSKSGPNSRSQVATMPSHAPEARHVLRAEPVSRKPALQVNVTMSPNVDPSPSFEPYVGTSSQAHDTTVGSNRQF